jgi:AAA ATPase domain
MEQRYAAPGRHPGLCGRAAECAVLDDVVSAIRRGESRSLVLRGEAGIGKTTLLEYLVDSASDVTVLRAAGVESEMELPFASLHQLCAPLLERVQALPAPQRDALRVVFGLSRGPPPDRFLVGLGVLSLLRRRRKSVRCWLSSTTRSRWIRRPRSHSPSSPAVCSRSRLGSCSPRATRARSFGTSACWRSAASATATPVRCSARWCDSNWTSACATASSRRRVGIRWRCSSCHAG